MGEEEEWMNNEYSSLHQILLLGEGDFSFALSLALSFGSATNILATSLDSYDSLIKKYKRAKSNLDLLDKLGASLIHGVDATKMKLHTDLKMRKFDRIVFNFPHAGFHGTEQSLHLINKHKRLVDGFFNNASHMLRANGEIHVKHKTSGPFSDWNLEKLASQNSLILISCVPFKIEDYPGYSNKRGDGSRCDEPFRLGKCSTFKFILSVGRKKGPTNHSQKTWEKERNPDTNSVSVGRKKVSSEKERNPDTNSVSVGRKKVSTNHSRKGSEKERNPTTNAGVNHYSDSGYNKPVVSRNVRSSGSDRRFRVDFVRIFRWYFDYVEDTFGLREERIGYHVYKAVNVGYERFSNMNLGRPSTGEFINYLEELHRLSLKRIEWLKQSLENDRRY